MLTALPKLGCTGSAAARRNAKAISMVDRPFSYMALEETLRLLASARAVAPVAAPYCITSGAFH